MPRKPPATTCRICGAPKRPNKVGLALCDEHLREYWRDQKLRRPQKRGPKPTESAPATITLSPDKVRQTSAPAPECMIVESRPIVSINGAKVSSSIDTFAHLVISLKAIAELPGVQPAPAAKRALKIAVIAPSLDTVRFYEVHTVSPARALKEAEYARQLNELREAGFVVCVEG